MFPFKQLVIGLVFAVINYGTFNAAQELRTGQMQHQRFEMTQAHVRLLRQVRIVWDPSENGAPVVHPREPFGSVDVLADVARISGLVDERTAPKRGLFTLLVFGGVKLPEEAQRKAEKLLDDLFPAMEIALQHGAIHPGSFALSTRNPKELEPNLSQVDFVASERERKLVIMTPPRIEGGSFVFTEDHRRLLKLSSSFLRDNGLHSRDESYLDLPALDAKRPYGDMKYYPLDIASALGVPLDDVDYEDRDAPPFGMKKLEAMVTLHLQMLPAMIVFLENAEIPLGTYVKAEGEWDAVSKR